MSRQRTTTITYSDGEEACGRCGGLILLGERVEYTEGLHLCIACASFSPGLCKVPGCNLFHAGECF